MLSNSTSRLVDHYFVRQGPIRKCIAIMLEIIVLICFGVMNELLSKKQLNNYDKKEMVTKRMEKNLIFKVITSVVSGVSLNLFCNALQA